MTFNTSGSNITAVTNIISTSISSSSGSESCSSLYVVVFSSLFSLAVVVLMSYS